MTRRRQQTAAAGRAALVLAAGPAGNGDGRRAAMNPAGRLDVLLLRLAEEATRQFLEPAAARLAQRPVELWAEIRPVVEREVRRLGIPSRPVTIDDVLALGAPVRRRPCIR